MLDTEMSSPLENQTPMEAGPQPSTERRGPRQLIKRTLDKAWRLNIFSEGAEAGFWATLSLPPLLLGLLGCLGFIGDWFGQGVVRAVYGEIIDFSETVFSSSVVQNIIEPTVNGILTTAQGEVASVGFLISLFAGSSAMSSYVDAITVAHGQYGVRNEIWQRILAMLLYMVGLVIAVIGLPVLAIGPDYLPRLVPDSWQPTVETVLAYAYYPSVGLLTALALATLYKLALPRKLPWHRGLPGAILAMAVFLLASIGLRIYISWITTTGYTYGALAAPIAFLLFTFFIGLAISLGAYFNASIQELWPAGMTRRQRRKWHRLEMERTAELIRAEESREAWLAPDGAGGPADEQASDPAAQGAENGRAGAGGTDAAETAQLPGSPAADAPPAEQHEQHRGADLTSRE